MGKKTLLSLTVKQVKIAAFSIGAGLDLLFFSEDILLLFDSEGWVIHHR